ncbi:putative major facilitator superfamily transporter [Pseudomonas aeruginosa]|nr:putative major facilitator superfamily transporter [Pseudomonas aeruginosa]
MSTASTLNSTTLPLSDSTHDRVTWRLMPLLLVCYVFAHLDRINIGFAKLQMSADLHFSDTVYGLGAGLFFIAYALFGLPSNLMLERIGPRRWIACLMLVWGCLSTAMLLVETARGFYLLRFLLGVAEAGFFPRYPGLPEPLVPGAPTRADHRSVRHRRAHGRGDRRTAFGLDPRRLP